MSKQAIETHVLFYTLTFLSMFGMGFVGATYATFLSSYGLDRLSMNIVNTFFMITLLLGEVPTGAIADVFGRKRACVMAFAIRAAGMVVYGFSYSFWAFVLAEVISGIGLTFENGALQAWAIDRLKHFEGEDTVLLLYERKAQFKLLGVICGGLSGAYIGRHDLTLPWFCGAGILVLTSILTLCIMREEYFEAKKYSFINGVKAFSSTISEGLHFGMKSSAIQFLFAVNAVLMFATQAPNMFWQLYFKPHASSQIHLGIIHVCMMTAMFVGATYGLRFATKVGCDRRAILVSLLFVGFLLAIAGAVPFFILSLPAFMLHEIGRGMFEPIKDKYLNANIPSEMRATLDSLQSTTRYIGAALGLLVSGLIATRMSDGASWVVSGAILALGATVLYLRLRLRTTNGTS